VFSLQLSCIHDTLTAKVNCMQLPAVGTSSIDDQRDEYTVLVLLSSIIVLLADETLVSIHGELKDLPPLEFSSLPLMLKV
jgi:hypothetical protein